MDDVKRVLHAERSELLHEIQREQRLVEQYFEHMQFFVDSLTNKNYRLGVIDWRLAGQR